MLVVATPKSASSALIATLVGRHGIPNETARIRRAEIRACALAAGFRQLERFHRHEVCEVDAATAAAVAAPGLFAKLHLPPTPNNQARLAHVKKVVLLRDPEEVVLAYQRGDESGAFKLRHPSFCFCLTPEGWMRRARETGLLDELRAFVDGWRAHPGEKLLVESRELIAEPAATLARIERHLGLAPSGAAELSRVRFTRTPAARRATPHILFARRRIIVQRVQHEIAALVRGNRVAPELSAGRHSSK